MAVRIDSLVAFGLLAVVFAVLHLVTYIIVVIFNYLADLFFSWVRRRKGLDYDSPSLFFKKHLLDGFTFSYIAFTVFLIVFWYLRFREVGLVGLL